MKQSEVSHHARRCQATDVMHMSLCEKYDALEAYEMQNSFKHTEYDSNVGMLQDQCWSVLFFSRCAICGLSAFMGSRGHIPTLLTQTDIWI